MVYQEQTGLFQVGSSNALLPLTTRTLGMASGYPYFYSNLGTGGALSNRVLTSDDLQPGSGLSGASATVAIAYASNAVVPLQTGLGAESNARVAAYTSLTTQLATLSNTVVATSNALIVKSTGSNIYTSLGSNLAVNSTFTASTLGVAGNASIGAGYVAIAAPSNGLLVQGPVGLAGSNGSSRLFASDFDGACDPTCYGAVQITSTSNTSNIPGRSNQAALSFVRYTSAAVGLGWAPGSNVFGFGTGTPSTSAFSPSLLSFTTSNGYIGIGNNAPAYKVDVTGTMRVNGTSILLGSNFATGYQPSISTEQGGTTTPVLDVGVNWVANSNTTLPAALFRINMRNKAGTTATTGLFNFMYGASGTPAVVSSVTFAGAYLQSSDERLKTGITRISNALDINGYTYTRKNDPTGTREMGVLAQEVEARAPELVATNPDDGMKSVSYANMVALLIECVKELQARVAVLEAPAI